jgi:N-acetylglucosaminyldiphosphoundecaprenol N-acetyl-beta-D-mannosaminyltransferase
MYKLLLKVRKTPLDFDISFKEKLRINTINAYLFNLCLKDKELYNALFQSDILLPDGVGAQMASKSLTGINIKKISGYELFIHEMEKLDRVSGKCFFLGSSENVLSLIRNRLQVEYPNVKSGFYSPPFKPVFSVEENQSMLDAVNSFSPDVLFVGMTAPKQEKWVAAHFDRISARHICSIGAVFDFYAGTISRAPQWMINLGLEWFYRFIREPKRMWRRYLLGNTIFLYNLVNEKIKGAKAG